LSQLLLHPFEGQLHTVPELQLVAATNNTAIQLFTPPSRNLPNFELSCSFPRRETLFKQARGGTRW